MNLNTALQNDYKFIDSDSATSTGRHALTLKNPDGTSTTCTNAIRRASLHNDIVQNEMGLVTTTCRWHVWKSDLADTTFVPEENGGYITDASSNTWRINSVQLMTAGTRYEIETTLEGGKGLR